MAEENLDPNGVEGAEDVPTEDVVVGGVEDTPQEETPEPTIQDLASNMGWSPKDEWRGDPEKWKPADQFIQATVEVNAKLNSRLKGLDSKIESIHRTNSAMTERVLADQRQKLLEERREAFDTGDAEKFDQVEKKLGELQAQPAQQVQPPEVEDFLERHSWLKTDKEAANWASNRAGELAAQGLGTARQLAAVEREAKNLFPEYFKQEEPKPKGVPLNKPGIRGGSSPRAKTFAALPKEAQKEALYYEKKGIPREDYAKTYFEEQEA